MNIVLLGPPGSGKGTQAKRMAEAVKSVHLSTGDVFRDAIKGGSELGREIKGFVESGKLVPDELVSAVVFEKLTSMKSDQGFLLDGYPRTLGQAVAFDEFLKEKKMRLDSVLFFDVASAELIKRLSSRRQCPKCKEVYNLVLKPPKNHSVCDVCGNALQHRPDDQVDIVKKRLDIYQKETEPILDHYKKHPAFKRIDAAQGIDHVFADVMASLSHLKV